MPLRNLLAPQVSKAKRKLCQSGMATSMEEQKPFGPKIRAAQQEWILEWKTAAPGNFVELEKMAGDGEGVKLVEELPMACTHGTAVNEYFNDGFKDGMYNFWFFHSEGHTFTKVIVSEERPNYDMILTGEFPALGMVMFRAEDENAVDIWRDLADQIVEKARN